MLVSVLRKATNYQQITETLEVEVFEKRDCWRIWVFEGYGCLTDGMDGPFLEKLLFTGGRVANGVRWVPVYDSILYKDSPCERGVSNVGKGGYGWEGA